MKPHEIIQVSVEGLIANKLRTILTVLGVIIGVASIVLLIISTIELKTVNVVPVPKTKFLKVIVPKESVILIGASSVVVVP